MTRPTLADWPITAVATLTACAGGVWLGWQLRGVVPASARRPATKPRGPAVRTVRADEAPRLHVVTPPGVDLADIACHLHALPCPDGVA